MPQLNQDEIKNLIQILMTLVGAALVSHGVVTGTDWSTLTGSLLGVVGPVWSVVAHWNMKKVPETAKIASMLVIAIGLAIFACGQASAQNTRMPAAKPKPAAVAAAPAGKVTMNQVQANPIALIQKFTVSDLQAALADAQGQTPPDTVAAACYTALIPVVQSGVANPLPSGPGLFQAVQKARDAKALLANLQSPTGPLAELNQACAPLILDAQTTLIQLGVMTGAVVGTGGIGGLALPFALPVIP